MLRTVKRRVERAGRMMFEELSGASPAPSDLAAYTQAHLLPLPPVTPDAQKWFPASKLGMAGIDLNEAAQLERIGQWKANRFQSAFASLRGNPSINTERTGQNSLTNGWYNTPDAEIYAAMLLDRNPRQVVEVGAGFSTRIAHATASDGGLQTRVTVIDPEPRTDIETFSDHVIRMPVEQSGLADWDWSAGDLLFIDSSHICRTRGDVPYLFCEVIPRLPTGVLVHVHDIYLPFDYPNNLDPLCYTEQYLLQALLSHSPRYKTVLTSHWLSRTHPEKLREVLGSEVARDIRLFGGCYWFETV